MSSRTMLSRSWIRRWIAAVVVPAALGLILVGKQSPVVAHASVRQDASIAAMANPQWRGVSSCAAAACHNAYGLDGTKGSEFTTWATGDPHNQAYRVLFNERSLIIEKNLRKLSGIAEAHPEKDSLCLKCHANEIPGSPPELGCDGVGCESCHGSSGQWLTIHYLDEWKTKTDEDKLRLGMAPTRNLYYRMKMCAECHIGSSNQEVNHDLIAAGHPRLSFEYSSFYAKTHKHWKESEEKSRIPDLEARTWALGQIESAQSALELLAHRASTPSSPWPEFTEYDCFACHHNLEAKSWRQKPNVGRRPGAFPWGTWYFPELPDALESWSVKAGPDLLPRLDQLKNEMQKASPNRKSVADQARQLADQLAQLGKQWESTKFDRASLDRIYQKLLSNEASAKEGWDQSAQRYLGMAAIFHAKGDLDHGARTQAGQDFLIGVRKALEFPRNYDSPVEFKPKR